MNKERPKLCTVRLPPELHAKAKTYAYSIGITMQELVIRLIKELPL